ncbi:unnamed protein product [Adineta ricciae]|uniref:NAD(P)(+)--arginine ADP-ribosyltransferase n=1 Tax=Adineta ricciae TaxID=249248 RepID=A0A814JFZ3_ADIRI|nr:unnamed protein product [Adineta ricciae]CAF1441251.1 unnamed protein product [Adineta ricciae]
MATMDNVNRRLLASIRDEPERMLQPISGYEQEPLVSLERACQPLEHLFDNNELKQNIFIAKMNSTQPKDGLSADESASIHLYTMEWSVHENSLYAILNRTLRLADRNKLRPWFKYLKLFLTAFFKLPQTGHITIYRGVPEDLRHLYKEGKKVTWWSVSSCTTSLKVLESPYYVGTSGVRTMFHIETRSGKIIRAHSYYQHEDEILLPPGLYFEIVSNFSPAPGLYMIQLREIQPPYKMLADPFDLKPRIKDDHKTSSQTSVAKKVSQTTTPSNSSLYSTRKLECHGYACATCGLCRDWFWRSHGSAGKIYKRHTNAKCTVQNYSCGRGYYYYHGDYRLCECADNI